MKSLLFFVLINILVFTGYSQESPINQVDENGLKTGLWKKYYDNGNLMYEGFFEAGEPLGLLTRYYEGGVKKAEMNFLSGGISYAKLYYESMELAAEGKYIGRMKDSTWNYYSFYNERLALKEQYSLGKKDGFSIKFYDNHEIAERLFWKNDVKHGEWEQFFENGQTRLKCQHIDGKRHGKFESFASDGSYTIMGNYNNGIMEGKWIYYKENNEVDLELEYLNGKMLPNPEYESRQKEFSKLLDESTKTIAEPNSIEFR